MAEQRTQRRMVRMTEGSEIRHILKFMLPMLIGNLFQQFYTMVDSIVVGRFVSATALGSVGSVGSIQFLFLSLCIGLAGGVNVTVAQHYGAEDEDGVKRTVGNAIYVAGLSGLLMSVISVCLASPILHLMGVPDANFADALTYMKIVCGAMLVNAAYNTISQILCALGDSKTPLYFVIISSIINVSLDLLFVAVFHWGVAGVAWATVIAQLFSAAGAILVAYRKHPVLKLKKQHMLPSTRMLSRICWMGIPLAAQNAMGSVSGVIFQSVVNSFGSTVMAAYTAVSRVGELVSMPYGTMGTAVANFAGQNVGAARYDRVRTGCKKCIYLVVGFSLVMFLVMLFFGEGIIGLFVKDAEVIAIGYKGLMITTASYFFTGMVYIYKAMLNGAGDAAFSLFNGVFEVAVRIVLILAITSIPAVGFYGIWWTAIPASAISAAMCIVRYRSGVWKKKSIL